MLDLDVLTRGILELKPTTALPAGRAMATAYARYAGSATSCAGGAPVDAAIRTAELKLGAQLAAVFLTSKDPVTSATQMATAFAAFWMVPPIPFVGGAPGLVTVAVPAPLQAALLASWVIPAPNPGAAKRLARILDAWTRTVVVACGAPAPCLAPLI